jgi:hypothetical protein
MPAPKSAWKPRLAPIVFTIVAELASTGSVSTGVFQMLSAGSTGQPPIICCAEADPAQAGNDHGSKDGGSNHEGHRCNRRAAPRPRDNSEECRRRRQRPLTKLAPAVQF